MSNEEGKVKSTKLRISPKGRTHLGGRRARRRWPLSTLLRVAVEYLIEREEVAQCGLSNSEVADLSEAIQ